MENIGNIEIKKYRIGFYNWQMDIDKYRIENILLISKQPVQNRRYQKIMIRYFAIQNSASDSVISRSYRFISFLYS